MAVRPEIFLSVISESKIFRTRETRVYIYTVYINRNGACKTHEANSNPNDNETNAMDIESKKVDLELKKINLEAKKKELAARC